MAVEVYDAAGNLVNSGVSFAGNPGHYQLVGDDRGIIPIDAVEVINDPASRGLVPTASIILEFDDPLPDDRFTLTVSDSVTDPPGLNLDGENNAVEPHEQPLFPSGDGVPGGDFVARFTVDSRPEVGCWAAGSVYVDTNGNFLFDPENLDFTNRDIVYTLGFTSDDVFAGNFALNPGDTADGFDKLAAYGRVGGSYRWLVDTDNDGVPNVVVADPANINGLPVAGEFDGDPNNGEAYLSADGHDHLLAQGKLAQLTWDGTWVLSVYGFSYVEADGNGGESNTLEKILPINYVLAVTDDWDLV